MKAQIQLISILIIIGIVIALTAATYFWGKPLVDKRVVVTQLSTLESFMEKLDEEIVDMARSCTGMCEKTLNVPPGSFIKAFGPGDDTPDNNSIVLEFAVEYEIMGTDPVYLNTHFREEVAPYGETNSVITMRRDQRGHQYIMVFKLHYRELNTKTTPREGYKITLVPGIQAGHDRITISYVDTTTSPEPAANGGPLTITKIRIGTSGGR